MSLWLELHVRFPQALEPEATDKLPGLVLLISDGTQIKETDMVSAVNGKRFIQVVAIDTSGGG